MQRGGNGEGKNEYLAHLDSDFSVQAKCEKYWTVQGETKEYGPISVTCVSICVMILCQERALVSDLVTSFIDQ